MKKLLSIHNAPQGHWVGDGFPVRSLFSYQSHGEQLSPFLLLDHAGPAEFAPALTPRGVGQHPHRGFETVTIVYKGEVAHKDSTGNGGVIGPGDVQWMTAGAGILHEEFHSEAFTAQGGPLEMVQLWVNLPAQHKMTTPAYQAIESQHIPAVALPGEAGTVRVIAGHYENHKGPAHTFSPMQVWDMRLHANGKANLALPDGWPVAVVVLHGVVQVNEQHPVRADQFALLDRTGSDLALQANGEAVVLLLSGQPLDEPIVGYGPFVMNTQQEIVQAITDFNAGKFGGIPA